VRVLGVVDTDSYAKWGAALLDRMPSGWRRDLTVLANPLAPSAPQLRTALAGTRFATDSIAPSPLDAIVDRIVGEQPEVVLLSLHGPAVRVVIRAVTSRTARRPVFVSGLPGISIPATRKALTFRSQTDLLVLHSTQEVEAFGRLAGRMELRQDFALATLPFLPARAERPPGSEIVFAAQAIVPRPLEHRLALLGWLAETARRHPDTPVVIKLRAAAGEQQTHPEKHAYDDLLRGLADRPPNLVVSHGPMSEHLARARGLVTVSSTAAIEAAAMGVPALVLRDFGVRPALINPVFVGSGLLGDRDDLRAARFSAPDDGWLERNYLHPPSAEDWVPAIEALVARRALGPLPLRPAYRPPRGGPLRRAWDRKRVLGPHDRSVLGTVVLVPGLPARAALLAWRRARKRLRTAGLRTAGRATGARSAARAERP